MTYTGGLRARLIRDSVFFMVDQALSDLGWYDVVTERAQVTFVLEALDRNAAVPVNTVALSDQDDTQEPLELGSGLAEFRWAMNLDVYGENDSVALHLVGDLAAIMAGRMPSIGRPDPTVDVYDLTQATPTVIFRVQVENVRTDKAHDFPQPWLRYWRSCFFEVVDEHWNDETTEADVPFSGYGGY